MFVTRLPAPAFSAKGVLDLYLHRGSFETVLADEDGEQDTDRWCSHTPCGQEWWQILNQRIWNLRLELGHHLSPTAMRLMEFSPAQAVEPAQVAEPTQAVEPTQVVEPILYGPPQWARPSWTSGFAGSDFVLQADGTLRCPAHHPLTVQERRPERNGSVRIVYGARLCHCRPCPLRAQCQEATTTRKPRQVSAVLWPISSNQVLTPAPAPSIVPPEPPACLPALWGDWPRCHIRRHWLGVVRSQTVVVVMEAAPTEQPMAVTDEQVMTRAQRAHWRQSPA